MFSSNIYQSLNININWKLEHIQPENQVAIYTNDTHIIFCESMTPQRQKKISNQLRLKRGSTLSKLQVFYRKLKVLSQKDYE